MRDYPLSSFADDANAKLKELEMPVPEPDQVAVKRMNMRSEHKR